MSEGDAQDASRQYQALRAGSGEASAAAAAEVLDGTRARDDALHYTALLCTALHCTAFHSTALHCTALHSTVFDASWNLFGAFWETP